MCHEILSQLDTAKTSFAERYYFNSREESTSYLKIYISFEQCQAHLTQRGVDISFAERAVPTQLFEDILKLVAELWKHDLKVLRGASGVGAFPSAQSGSKAAAPWKRAYLFGVAIGFAAGAPPVAPSSIPNVQCASTFFPWDFALTITVHDLSRSFCVT